MPNRGGRLKPGMFATVSFGGSAQTALLVPSVALIRTGKRTLVMLALDKGRYQPAEVQTGQEPANDPEDRKSVVQGKRVSVRVDLGGGRIIKKKNITDIDNHKN